MTKFIINKSTNVKIDVNWLSTITRPKNGQMRGKDDLTAESSKLALNLILSVCTLIDDKNEPMTAQEVYNRINLDSEELRNKKASGQ